MSKREDTLGRQPPGTRRLPAANVLLLRAWRLHQRKPDESSPVGWIISHYEQAAHWLPGICDGCERWCLTRTEAYWGAHPHFCNRCLAWTIRYFEENGKWPEGNWFPGEKFELDEPELLDEEEPDEEI